ncbi:MAG: hypothetical protein A2X36_06400 [Elusimicrobia bacterium GWA2_69_24]|nr:MAG: hypothetical protein A2X36_06400 [Elusimicrobia bacterium GWA2_69_24]HBL17074.1 succinate-semialdehyde dehydrogenase [Elusimicrobiota bacterium]
MGPAAAPSPLVERAERAREAQARWRRHSLAQRVRAVRGLWADLLSVRERLIGVIREETGKPAFEAGVMEADAAGCLVSHFTREAARVLSDQAAPKPWVFFNKRAYVRQVPRGVVGLITPWNMPFLIPFGDAVPALLAGNAVLLKPSEWTPRTALFLEERFRDCGLFPEGLLQVVTGGGGEGAALIGHVDMVLFTGSVATGKSVARAAAERMIPAVLELGGLHPMIVARDASLSRAVKAAVWGRFANCGQLCVGVERVFVERPLYPAFCQELVRETGALRQSLEAGDAADVGRLVTPGQLDRVERHLDDARAKGARVLGGEVLDRARLLVRPAIVLDATPEMLVMREETFGPVLPVMPVETLEDAVRLANESSLGLAASVWTADPRVGEAAATQLEAGLVGVNDVSSHYVFGALPFGGFKQSGMGRRHSDEGLRMFCQSQSVIVHEWPADSPDPWWFPYDRAKARLLELITRWT